MANSNSCQLPVWFVCVKKKSSRGLCYISGNWNQTIVPFNFINLKDIAQKSHKVRIGLQLEDIVVCQNACKTCSVLLPCLKLNLGCYKYR